MKKLYEDVLGILSEDSRTSADEIALMLKKSREEVKAAVTDMENSGVILKYGVLVDEEKLQKESVQALIEVRVTPKSTQGFDEIAADISRFDEVKSLYLMSGAYDLCIIIEGKTLKEVALFVSEKLSCLDSVLSTATHFILKKYKLEGVNMRGDTSQRLVVHP